MMRTVQEQLPDRNIACTYAKECRRTGQNFHSSGEGGQTDGFTQGCKNPIVPR